MVKSGNKLFSVIYEQDLSASDLVLQQIFTHLINLHNNDEITGFSPAPGQHPCIFPTNTETATAWKKLDGDHR